jgi:NADPH-dependent 2,4-dienoyl-CoA reductase/sulfur reductase-like enzyme
MNIVIVGGGASAYYVSKNLRTTEFDGEINIITNEYFLPYNRILLPRVLKEEIGIEKVFFENVEYYKRHNIGIHFGFQVSKLDGKIDIKKTEISNLPVELSSYINKSNFEIESVINLINTADLIIWAVSGETFLPSQFDNSNSLTWKDLIDTINLRNQIKVYSNNNQRVCVVGGSFIGLELVMACRHYNIDFDWVIKTKTLLRDGIDQRLNNLLLEHSKNNGITNLFLDSSVENISENNNLLSYFIKGQKKEASKFLVGAGLKRDQQLTNNNDLVLEANQIVSGDLISYSPATDLKVFAGSFNQVLKSSKIVCDFVMNKIRDKNSDSKYNNITSIKTSLNALGEVLYQIRYFNKTIRLSGLMNGDYEIIETEKDITQIWLKDDLEKGKLLIQK